MICVFTSPLFVFPPLFSVDSTHVETFYAVSVEIQRQSEIFQLFLHLDPLATLSKAGEENLIMAIATTGREDLL